MKIKTIWLFAIVIWLVLNILISQGLVFFFFTDPLVIATPQLPHIPFTQFQKDKSEILAAMVELARMGALSCHPQLKPDILLNLPRFQQFLDCTEFTEYFLRYCCVATREYSPHFDINEFFVDFHFGRFSAEYKQQLASEIQPVLKELVVQFITDWNRR